MESRNAEIEADDGRNEKQEWLTRQKMDLIGRVGHLAGGGAVCGCFDTIDKALPLLPFFRFCTTCSHAFRLEMRLERILHRGGLA
jgi:hypothetical protein